MGVVCTLNRIPLTSLMRMSLPSPGPRCVMRATSRDHWFEIPVQNDAGHFQIPRDPQESDSPFPANTRGWFTATEITP